MNIHVTLNKYTQGFAKSHNDDRDMISHCMDHCEGVTMAASRVITIVADIATSLGHNAALCSRFIFATERIRRCTNLARSPSLPPDLLPPPGSPHHGPHPAELHHLVEHHLEWSPLLF